MKSITYLILAIIALMSLKCFAMTPEELTALAAKHPPTVITADADRNLKTDETVLILFEFDTNPWKDIYAPATGTATSFSPPLMIKSNYWAWGDHQLHMMGPMATVYPRTAYIRC
ncbi:MAG: hypothetical protein HC898_01190 [Phycisphaerales bacterium]|nr:hypothetical protein [Phycisphaerales bacterium]